jgi:hypothetical protein
MNGLALTNIWMMAGLVFTNIWNDGWIPIMDNNTLVDNDFFERDRMKVLIQR